MILDPSEGGVQDTITMRFSRVFSTVTEVGGSGGGGTVGEINICFCHIIHVVYCGVIRDHTQMHIAYTYQALSLPVE